jgi:hypothetical protein
MTALEWTLIAGLGVIYLSLMFTMAVVTFRKQHIALFVAGFILPILWLVGAMLAPKPGSNYRGPLS